MNLFMKITLRFFNALPYFLLFLFILTSNPIKAESEYINYKRHVVDSLKQRLNTESLTEKERMKLYDTIANWMQELDLDSSIFYATKGIALAKKLKDYKTLMGCYNGLGISFCFKGCSDSALYYFDLGKEIATKQGYKKDELQSIYFIAYAYAKQGKFHAALDYYLKCMRICEDEGWTDEKDVYTKCLTNISEIYRRLGNATMAIDYLKIAEQKNIEVKTLNYWQLSHVWNEFAFNYLKQNNLDEALRYALKADSIKQGAGTVNRCYTNGILATIFLKQNDYDRALQYTNQTLEEAEILKDVSLYAYAGKILSDVYLALKRYPEAEAEAMKVYEFYATYVDELQDLVKNIVLANIYMHNTEKAAFYLKKYAELNEQYNEKSYQTMVSDLSIKYETEKKELHIATLEQEKKLYIGFGVFGAAILLLAFGLLFFRHRINVQKKKLVEQQQELSEQKVKQLEQEQQLIVTQAVSDGESAERSRLARDLHDGLGGMLSVVKLNLKDMKHHALMDSVDVEHYTKALNMLDSSIGELRRIAHHIMPESLLRYGLKVSLEDFCHAIPGAHFQYFGEALRLDNHLEVLIYRCAYELINNALKHAQANAINIQLLIDNGVVSLTVQDNGIGFDPQTAHSGIGLENVRTRLALFNGKMSIHSAPEKGTEICIEIAC